MPVPGRAAEGRCQQKQTIVIIPTRERREKKRAKRVGNAAAVAEEKEEERRRKQAQKKQQVKAAVRAGKLRATVSVGDGATMQPVQLESGSDVDSGEDEVEQAAQEEAARQHRLKEAQTVHSVHRTNGSALVYGAAILAIKDVLDDHPPDTAVSHTTLKQYARIDLDDPANARFLEALQRHTLFRLDAVHKTVRLLSPLGVTNAQELASLFETRLANGVSEKELAGAYDGVEMDLDALVATGRVCDVVNDRGTERMYYRRPPGLRMDDAMVRLWKSIQLPPTREDLVKQLIQRGLRTQDQIDAREVRHKTHAQQERTAQRAKAARKRAQAAPKRIGKVKNGPKGSIQELAVESDEN